MATVPQAADAPSPSINDAIANVPTDAVPPGPASPIIGTPTGVVPYDENKTRENIAYLLLALLIGVIAVVVLVSLFYSFDCRFGGDKCQTDSAALQLLTSQVAPIFTAVIGIVGSVVGFYFGSKKS